MDLTAADFADHVPAALNVAPAALLPRQPQKVAVGEWVATGVTFAQGEIVLIDSTGTLAGDCVIGAVQTAGNGLFGWRGGAGSTLPGRELLACGDQAPGMFDITIAAPELPIGP